MYSMTALKIDYARSVETRRIVFDQSKWAKRWGLVFPLFFGMAILYIPSTMLWASLSGFEHADSLQTSLAFLIGAIAFMALLALRFRKVLRLRTIIGTDAASNRTKVQEIFQDSGWKLAYNNRQFLVAATSVGFTHWGRQFSVIFVKEKILINCVSFGLFHLVSPFHFFSDDIAYISFQDSWKTQHETISQST